MSAIKSVHAGLRAREIEKDTYERLHCAACGERLNRQPDPDTPDPVIICPACGREWRDL